MIINLPNFITLGRLLTVPIVVWLIVSGHFFWAFWVFVAAGVSDAADGFIAKRFNAETELGRFLDPIADKALLVSVYVSLGQQEYLASWLVILVVFRDALIVVGAMLFQALIHTVSPQPLLVSKVNTTAQIILAASVMGALAYDVNHGLGTVIDAMCYVVGFTTVLSGAAYVITWGRRAAAMEDGE